MAGIGREAYRMSGSGQKAVAEVLEWSGDPPDCLRVVGRPSWMFGGGRVALPIDREWLGGPPGCPGVVGRPAGCPGVVRRPSRMSGSGRETLLDVREALPDVRDW